jgi:signal transduction histidine kinase
VRTREKVTAAAHNDAEVATADAGERRLARIGFDLHDGPLQIIAALTADLRLLRAQAATAPVPVVQSRIDDALAFLDSLQTDVRELAGSLEPTTLLRRPLDELVQAEADQAEADGLAVTVRVAGDVHACTPSQRIALFRVVQEALWNVRHHSGAAHASVTVEAGATVLRAEIVDDGRGFDVESARRDSGRSGRIGLVGMNERIRLLGGTLDVVSAIGGPTTVRATIPRWRPAAGSGYAATMPRLNA